MTGKIIIVGFDDSHDKLRGLAANVSMGFVAAPTSVTGITGVVVMSFDGVISSTDESSELVPLLNFYCKFDENNLGEIKETMKTIFSDEGESSLVILINPRLYSINRPNAISETVNDMNNVKDKINELWNDNLSATAILQMVKESLGGSGTMIF